MPDLQQLEFVCNGTRQRVPVAAGASLLGVLREQLGLRSLKDGCAPQGQCGCCTVLVDGDARVACVTPATRVAGRRVTTLEGLDPARRSTLVDAFVAAGASQCGFCTPGILLRAAALVERGKTAPSDVERALSAHLCRCTGWRTIVDAITGDVRPEAGRRLSAATTRATLEGDTPQRVGPDVPAGGGGFAEDTAPADALVAVPVPPSSTVDGVEAAGLRWVVAETLGDARSRAGTPPGRRSPRADESPLPLPAPVPGGVRLTTSWVEPAYLEPDAAWCEPGGEPASPLANGGAFGGKTNSAAPAAARELSDRLGRAVRVVYSREDTVRLGPKRPPIAATAVVRDGAVFIDGSYAAAPSAWPPAPDVVTLPVREHWASVPCPGPPTDPGLRAFPLAERTVLREGALAAAGVDGARCCVGDRVAGVRLATVAAAPEGGLAGARVELDAAGGLARVAVRVAGGDPLDEVVLRSFCLGATHMALGWVLTEGIAVDPERGEVLDLTIRSFGILRARAMPPVDLDVVDEAGPPCPVSGAVFAAVAAAAWEAISGAEGRRPEAFPTRATRAARAARG
jgi:aerobic-type carbon monoxide dehydrogenase small subunit (CoxS/CutS family)